MNIVVADASHNPQGSALVLPAPTRQATTPCRCHIGGYQPPQPDIQCAFVSASATTVADRGDADAMPTFWAKPDRPASRFPMAAAAPCTAAHQWFKFKCHNIGRLQYLRFKSNVQIYIERY